MLTNLVEADDGPAYSVRNTFIDFKLGGPPHTDGCLDERNILSCPAKRIGMMTLPLPAGFAGFDTAAEAAAAAVAMALLPSSDSPSMQQAVLGSPEMPTVGSIAHDTGNCKPCAFFYNQGCDNGIECKFCHLCQPGEKKRRQKEKKAQLRRMQQVAIDSLPLEVTCSQTSPTLFSSECAAHLPSVPYDVKNTFIQTPLDISMAPPEREILSCPASKIGRMLLPRPLALDSFDFEDLGNVPLDTPQPWPVTPLDNWPSTLPPTPLNCASRANAEGLSCLDSLLLAGTMPALVPPMADTFWLDSSLAPPMAGAPRFWQPMEPPPPPAGPPSKFLTCESVESALAAKSAPVLRLADSMLQPELGTAEMPTIGSMNHHFGTCKPCAFLYKQGCNNGVHCQFCHICDPGEKKRRQKDKKAQLLEARA
jgi:hypothetical protein